MESVPHWMRLAFAMSTVGLTLLTLASWRRRSSSIGRVHLYLTLSATGWTMAHLVTFAYSLAPRDTAGLSAAFYLGIASFSLRLATLAAEEGRELSLRDEAIIWIPPILTLVLATPSGAALWASFAFALASLRWAQVPMRSWGGFGLARRAASLVCLGPALAPVAWVAGLPSEWLGVVTPLVVFGMILGLHLALPRLGLTSTDLVQHGTVIEAMSDGVLVVDLQGRLVDFNQAAREIFRIDERRASRRELAEVLAHHPDLIELLNGAIDGRTVYTPDGLQPEGSERTFELQLSALYDANGAIESRVVVLRDISDRIAIEEENRRQARYVRLVHEVSATVHEARTIEAGLGAALGLIAKTMELPLGHFLRSSDEDGLSRLVPSGVFHVDRGVEGAARIRDAIAEDCAALFRTVEEDYAAPAPEPIPWWRRFGFEAVLTVPVLIGPRLYGLFEFFADDRIEFDERTTEMLEHVGELVGRAIERKLAEERIRRLAYRDDLTGLPNRQRFHQLLAGAVSQASRSNRRMALLFMDLDGFKQVNDTLGHEMGDRLLAEVARRFSNAVRVSDHIGCGAGGPGEAEISRLGGDEFTVLLTEIHQPADAALVADRLLSTLERPVVLAGQELFVTTSIGIAIYPEDGLEADRLLRNSDAAMYFAKGRGRNGYQFYSEEMNRSRASRLEIESRLRSALERDEFELHYQPIVDASSGEVIAAEALLRWCDGQRGMVPPDVFIPVAEETGLIVSLGSWVFRSACAQARIWRDEGHPSIRIGVNVSGHQIRQPGMVEMVRQALGETGVAPEQLELEITESTIMQDDPLTVRTLRELRQMNVGLSLDDFGTGYSSLSYLRRFTIDRVKIDRSFVSELPDNADDAALTAAIVAMAHGMRLKVVAEGVETTRQALFLQDRGCDELQGYLLGRPCPAREFADRMRSKPRSIREMEKEEG